LVITPSTWTIRSRVICGALVLCRSCQGGHIANGGPYVLKKIVWRCSGGLQGVVAPASAPAFAETALLARIPPGPSDPR